ncbi:MAG: HD domain-containing protein [Chloroflexi bacterium OHK40]
MWSQDRYTAASRFAAIAHNGQHVPGTDLPYLLHVTQVAMETAAALCAEPGHDEDLAIQCALLHDTVEDTTVTYEQLDATFGRAVADGVLALTKDKTLPKDAQMDDSLRRIQAQPRAVWLVKLADRVVNLQPPPKHWTAEQQEAYRAEARTILAALGEASPLLATRLAQKIEAYGR